MMAWWAFAIMVWVALGFGFWGVHAAIVSRHEKERRREEAKMVMRLATMSTMDQVLFRLLRTKKWTFKDFR